MVLLKVFSICAIGFITSFPNPSEIVYCPISSLTFKTGELFKALNNTDPNEFSGRTFLLVPVYINPDLKFKFLNISVLKLNLVLYLVKLDLPPPIIPSCVNKEEPNA